VRARDALSAALLTLLATRGVAVASDDSPPPAPPAPAPGPTSAPPPAADGRVAAATAALESAVDLPEPAARRAAALALASGKSGTTVLAPPLSVDEWLTLAKKFGAFEAVSPGTTGERVPLYVGSGTEPGDVAVHVPKAYDPAKPTPLLLALHGAGSDGMSELSQWQAFADSFGLVVIAPTDLGKNLGYTFGESERLAGLSALRWARRRFDVDENRVYASGSSRGGHMTWDLALRLPDRFAAIAPFIGGPRWNLVGGQNNLRFVENLANVPIRDLQGMHDDSGLILNLRMTFARLKDFHAKDALLVEFPDLGHAYDWAKVDWAAFLGGSVRDPRPSRVVRMAVKPDAGRAFWVEVTRLSPDVAEQFQPTQPKEWPGMTPEAQKKWLAHEADKRTGRLEVRMDAPGKFTATGTGVTAFRLLLDDSMLPAKGPVSVSWNGRAISKGFLRDPKVLLTEFVERFDRTFLPVVEVTVP
jgi:predicted esterase